LWPPPTVARQLLAEARVFRMPPSAQSHSKAANFAALMRPWTKRWGLPGLEDGVSVHYDPRLRRSIGRCRPHDGEISLHPALADAPSSALATVLCHELAHVAAYQLYGAEVRPHGEEWAALVSIAGHRPSASVRATALGIEASGRRFSPRPRRRTYVHRCPVCQTTRLARRPVHTWRCAECAAAGLEGRLTITPREGAGE
jgi:predicted SprT family Zn-dependent metalloprotease